MSTPDRRDMYRERARASMGLEERIIQSIATILARRDFLLEKAEEDGRLHPGSEREVDSLEWVLADCVATRYPGLMESALRVAEDFARRRAARRVRG